MIPGRHNRDSSGDARPFGLLLAGDKTNPLLSEGVNGVYVVDYNNSGVLVQRPIRFRATSPRGVHIRLDVWWGYAGFSGRQRH